MIWRAIQSAVGLFVTAMWTSSRRSSRTMMQNGFAERPIGSIRRECLDQIIVCGEEHLRRTLLSYASYYNRARTHRSLNKDAPVHRPIQRLGALRSHPVLGGLHHQYVRMSLRYRQKPRSSRSYSATQGAAGASPVAALYCFASGSASSLFRMR